MPLDPSQYFVFGYIFVYWAKTGLWRDTSSWFGQTKRLRWQFLSAVDLWSEFIKPQFRGSSFHYASLNWKNILVSTLHSLLWKILCMAIKTAFFFFFYVLHWLTCKLLTKYKAVLCNLSLRLLFSMSLLHTISRTGFTLVVVISQLFWMPSEDV